MILKPIHVLMVVILIFISSCSTIERKQRKQQGQEATQTESSTQSVGNSEIDSGIKSELNSEDTRGLASWYGRKFQHRRTASGERFDMHEFTAAHRTLPFGSVIRVRNLRNGKAVIVRINDRGPPSKKRLIDLSYAAGRALGILRAGVTPVRIEKI